MNYTILDYLLFILKRIECLLIIPGILIIYFTLNKWYNFYKDVLVWKITYGLIIDRDIKIDVSILPKSVQEEIKELERLHEEKDWFNYDLKFDELEMNAKRYVIRGTMSDSLYKKLLEKYGGLYDWNKKFR